jgi:hypothetical protein
MAIQPSTFNPLPDKEVLRARIAQQKAHLADLASYMLFIMPVARRFGEQVYDVAASFLAEKDFKVTPEQLRLMAQDMRTPEGKAREAKSRRLHASLLFGGGSGPPPAELVDESQDG